MDRRIHRSVDAADRIPLTRAQHSDKSRGGYPQLWHVYVVSGQPPAPAFAAFRRAWGSRPNPPAITGVFVAGLANPDFLAEVDAVAVVPA